MTDVVSFFMLMLGRAGLLVDLFGGVHLAAHVGVDAQSLRLIVPLKVRGALSLS